MEIHLVERETFYICGYSVETTLEQNAGDVSALYRDFFAQEKDRVLLNLNGAQNGYYGLSWYTQGHTRYRYLLGIEVGFVNTAPQDALIKEVPGTTYAVAHFGQGDDIIKAWYDFFYTAIPQSKLAVNEALNLYFEYYPGSVSGAYELWVPVVQADI